MINFIRNDPQATPAGGATARRVTARPDRPANRAGFVVVGNEPEGVHAPGTIGFVQWQARQAAILALEAWEAALGTPIASWSSGVADPHRLTLVPDDGDDINAYYNRASVSFFHHDLGTRTAFSGASTDVVAHEVGHGVLDAVRPDLWATPYLEAGGFHEGFGDVTALLTALADKTTRKSLLSVSPNLDKANFVEGTAEDLSDAIRIVAGPNHPASKPRRALNKFKWQLPSTMPTTGGPDVMIAEVHSIARIITGCFWDVLRAMYTSSGPRTEANLWKVTKTTAKLFYTAAANAPEMPRFFRSVGRAMVLADANQNGGANRQIIGKAFADHGLALGSQALLAPELALAGDAPKIDRRSGTATVQPATTRDLRARLGATSTAKPRVSMVELDQESVAKVSFQTEVSLGDVDPRLAGVVTYVDVPALVGSSGRSAALLSAPRAGAPTEEVHDFVRSLLAHGQLEVPAAAAGRRSRGRAGAMATALPTPVEKPTHAVVKRGSRQELRRVRFACGG